MPTRPSLVSSSFATDSLPASGAVSAAGATSDFNSLRRECGTAPGGATRTSSGRRKNTAQDANERKMAVQELLKDEAWFADADSPLDNDLLADDCPSPTLFLSEPSPSLFGDMGINDAFDAADPDESSTGSMDISLEGEASPEHTQARSERSGGGGGSTGGGGGGSGVGGGGSGASASGREAKQHPGSAGPRLSTSGIGSSGGDGGGPGSARSGSGRSRVVQEGGMNGMALSPRGSFERSKKKRQNNAQAELRNPESNVLKGLLNSAEMENRLAAASQDRHFQQGPESLRLIPSPNLDLSLQLERPPSRQRNLPMHLNSDLLLGLPSHDGQLSPDVERKCVSSPLAPAAAHHTHPPSPLQRILTPPRPPSQPPQPLAPAHPPPRPVLAQTPPASLPFSSLVLLHSCSRHNQRTSVAPPLPCSPSPRAACHRMLARPCADGLTTPPRHVHNPGISRRPMPSFSTCLPNRLTATGTRSRYRQTSQPPPRLSSLILWRCPLHRPR